MKLLSYLKDDREAWSAVVGDGVATLDSATGHATLASFLGSPDFDRRDTLLSGLAADLPLAGLQRELSNEPPIFLRAWRSQVGHLQPVVRPRVSETLEW